MPLDWQPYEAFDWNGSSQHAMAAGERAAVTELAADVLGLPAADRESVWGSASPPGRFAATVVRVSPGVPHRHREPAAAAGVASVGVKVFKTTGDATREAAKIVPFHRTELHRLPGLPNDRVQRSLDAGNRRDSGGRTRAFVVQEWVEGDTLEDLVRRRWVAEPVAGAVVRSVIEQLLGRIVVPLWARGTVWWDFRDANYCFDAVTGRLGLIDVDSLGAYADEILRSPHRWEQRNKGRATALPRLRQMVLRVLLAQGLRGKSKVAAALSATWAAELEPTLAALGKVPEREAEAAAAVERFVARLEREQLIV